MITLTWTERVVLRPTASFSLQVRIHPVLNGNDNADIEKEFGMAVPLPLSTTKTQRNAVLPEAEYQVIKRLRGYIDRVLDNSIQASWLEPS